MKNIATHIKKLDNLIKEKEEIAELRKEIKPYHNYYPYYGYTGYSSLITSKTISQYNSVLPSHVKKLNKLLGENEYKILSLPVKDRLQAVKNIEKLKNLDRKFYNIELSNVRAIKNMLEKSDTTISMPSKEEKDKSAHIYSNLKYMITNDNTNLHDSEDNLLYLYNGNTIWDAPTQKRVQNISAIIYKRWHIPGASYGYCKYIIKNGEFTEATFSNKLLKNKAFLKFCGRTDLKNVPDYIKDFIILE